MPTKSKTPSVLILGGGVAGLSAAHELVERGFDRITVIEKQAEYVGGKARSVRVPDSAGPGKKPLPGEHGFRFFPGFYRHITDTMKRIPFPGNKHGVFDNLVQSQRVTMAREGQNIVVNIVNYPSSKKDIQIMLKALTESGIHFSEGEVDVMIDKIWQLATSCRERRLQDYENLSWLNYTNASLHSKNYNEFFVGGLTRTLVAAKAGNVSTRTGGDILLQLLYQMATPGKPVDRVLNAPTNDAWLSPWLEYLSAKGVKFRLGCTLKTLKCNSSSPDQEFRMTGVNIENEKGELESLEADYYFSAIPVEAIAPLINDDMLLADSRLGNLKALAKSVSWMTGLQLYLNTDVAMPKGHVIIMDSPWAVTAISQHQFWEEVDLSQYGHGNVKGIISIDISDWDKPGYNGKRAKDCTKQEILEEVWHQFVLGMRENNHPMFKSDMVVAAFLDRDIQAEKADPDDPTDGVLDVSKLPDWTKEASPKPQVNKVHAELPTGDQTAFKTINHEPLLVNRVNTWSLRPEPYGKITNFFLTGDYVRTNTDLATMEGANESARRAVNCLLDRTGIRARKCRIWNLHEPLLLWPFRFQDQLRFKRGLDWNENFTWLTKLAHWLIRIAMKAARSFT